MITLIAIAIILAIGIMTFALAEYRADTNEDLKVLERDLMVRHLKDCNK